MKYALHFVDGQWMVDEVKETTPKYVHVFATIEDAQKQADLENRMRNP